MRLKIGATTPSARPPRSFRGLLGFKDYWRETLPEALLSILEGYDRRASYLAAKAYIAKHPDLAEE